MNLIRNLMKDVPELVRASRDLLKAINKKNPRKLGEWGFEVNDRQNAKPAAI